MILHKRPRYLEPDTPEFKSLFFHILIVSPWISYLSFLISEVGSIISTFQGFLNWLIDVKTLQTMCAAVFSHVQLFEIPWTEAHQAPLSMEFSRHKYWSELPCPPPGDLPDPRIQPASLSLLHWQADSLLLHHLGSPLKCC